MRTDIRCKNEFKIGCDNCTIDSSIMCTFDCRECSIASMHMTKLNDDINRSHIPSHQKYTKGIYYLGNDDETIGKFVSIDDATKVLPGNYKEIGYSSMLIKRYPLFFKLKTILKLPLPDKILWYNDTMPIIAKFECGYEYYCIYAIASKIPRGMMERVGN